jgi:uncharacterized protein YcfJ
MLRKWMTMTTVLGALTATSALASNRGASDYVYAKVVDVRPIVRYVTVQRPRQECWDEVVYLRERNDRPIRVAGPAIAGGLIGGAIGRQFGGGSGRDALTVIGALAGSAIASERAARNQNYAAVNPARATTVERCEVTTETFREERIDGYDVTYQYRGRRYGMRTTEPPGERVRLLVSAVPVGYR